MLRVTEQPTPPSDLLSRGPGWRLVQTHATTEQDLEFQSFHGGVMTELRGRSPHQCGGQIRGERSCSVRSYSKFVADVSNSGTANVMIRGGLG